MRSLKSCASISDFVGLARARLPGFIWSYLYGGAGNDAGMIRNEAALAAILLKPKRLAGPVTGTGLELFGHRYDQPFGIAPLGMPNLVWPQTDRALFALAREKNIPFVLSTAGSSTIEAAAAGAGERLWFQLYMNQDDAVSLDLLRRAWQAGVRILVWTVDVPGPARRNHAQRAGFTSYVRWTARNMLDLALNPAWSLGTLINGTPSVANMTPYAGDLMTTVARVSKNGLSYADLKLVRDAWKGKLIVKGVQDGEEAARMIREGADGIWVSNHGGRQLEAAPATIDTLPEVRAGVPRDVPVMFDSGVRCGEDVLKALALGADFVFAGRAFLYGAAAFGARGVVGAFDILAAEIAAGLTQIGCASPEAIDESYIYSRAAKTLSGISQSEPALRALKNPSAAE